MVKCLTLFQKSKIIEDYDKGCSVTTLSKKYGVAKSTICSIKAKRTDIMKAVTLTFKPGKKTLKKAERPKLEKALHKWFLNQRKRNIPVSGEILREKALKLHNKMPDTSAFTASTGWLQRFKRRYGIRLLTMSGEKLSAHPDLVDPFKEKLKSEMEKRGLCREQVYNADETALYWKLLPKKTYVAINEKHACGLKVSKQRITFMGCTNATGSHKLTPLVIGKAQHPRCFRNFDNPLIYASSKNAWMTTNIFRNWFFKNFVPEVARFLRGQNLPEKALLILDNAPSHPPDNVLTTEDGSMSVLYFPPNVTALLQPLDQNILRLTKLHYRKNILGSILSQRNDAITVCLNKLTIKDAVINLATAWEKISSSTISNSWKNMFIGNVDEDDIPLNHLRNLIRANMNTDILNETTQLLNSFHEGEIRKQDVEEWNNDEIDEENEAMQTNFDSVSDDDDDENASMVAKVTHNEAITCLNKLMDWGANNLNVTYISHLQQIREIAIFKMSKAKNVQKNIVDYFK